MLNPVLSIIAQKINKIQNQRDMYHAFQRINKSLLKSSRKKVNKKLFRNIQNDHKSRMRNIQKV